MHALQLKPVCVSDSLKKGTKFVKWDDVSEGRRGGVRAGHPRAGCVGVGLICISMPYRLKEIRPAGVCEM